MELVKLRTLADPIFSKITDIKPGKAGYNLYAKVITKTKLIDIKRIDGSRVVIADFLIGDETGTIKMRLRTENIIDILNENMEIIIRNCKVPIVHSHIRIQVDAFGKVEISTHKKIKEIKLDRNISDDTYEYYGKNKEKYQIINKKEENVEDNTNQIS